MIKNKLWYFIIFLSAIIVGLSFYKLDEKEVEQIKEPVKELVKEESLKINDDFLEQVKINDDFHDAVTEKSEIANMIIAIQYEFAIRNSQDYIDAIYDASTKYKVPSKYLVAAIAEESSFHAEAKSWAGAIGPMQVIPGFWLESKYDPNVFYDNIQLGAFILQKYFGRCGETWECAFKAYNVGITNYRKGEKIAAQKRYWNKISKRYDHL